MSGVDISFVAPDAAQYQQIDAHFTLDGRPLAVPDDSGPGQRYLLFAGELSPGDHRLEVDLQYRRSTGFFTRGASAVLQVKGSADFRLDPGRHVSIVGRIQKRANPDAQGELPSFVAGINVSGPAPSAPAVSAPPPPTRPPIAAPPPLAHAPVSATPAEPSHVATPAARQVSVPVQTAPVPSAEVPLTRREAPESPKKKSVHRQVPAQSALLRLRQRLRSASAHAKGPKPPDVVKPAKASKPVVASKAPSAPKPTTLAQPRSDAAAVARLKSLLRQSVKGDTAGR